MWYRLQNITGGLTNLKLKLGHRRKSGGSNQFIVEFLKKFLGRERMWGSVKYVESKACGRT